MAKRKRATRKPKRVKCPRCLYEETRFILAKPPDKGGRFVCDGCGASWTDKKPPPPYTRAELRAAAFAAWGTVAKKELDRRQLREGSMYRLELPLVIDVGAFHYSESIEAEVHVGHADTSTTSSGPNTAHLVAHLLAKMPRATRERLLADLPGIFAEHGKLPKVDEKLITAADGMLKRLRSTQSVDRAASINCKFVCHPDTQP